jgi:hypothetical protein
MFLVKNQRWNAKYLCDIIDIAIILALVITILAIMPNYDYLYA